MFTDKDALMNEFHSTTTHETRGFALVHAVPRSALRISMNDRTMSDRTINNCHISYRRALALGIGTGQGAFMMNDVLSSPQCHRNRPNYINADPKPWFVLIPRAKALIFYDVAIVYSYIRYCPAIHGDPGGGAGLGYQPVRNWTGCDAICVLSQNPEWYRDTHLRGNA